MMVAWGAALSMREFHPLNRRCRAVKPDPSTSYISQIMDALNRPTPTADTAPAQDFVNAMASAAMGVSVVTTNGAHGKFGLTVSAWSSVSVEPPLLLACINRKNLIVEAITQNGYFAVNALDDSHEDVARVFAGRPKAGEPYVTSPPRTSGTPVNMGYPC